MTVDLGRGVSPAEVKSLAKCNELGGKEADFVGRPGYRRKYNADGSYRWRYRYPLNDHGKMTRQAHEVAEIMKPGWDAHTERLLNRPASPVLADDKTPGGWGHRLRVGGRRVERGVDGELWRELSDGTREPTGRWCLGAPAPWQSPPPGGNPDGTMRLE